MGIPVYGLLIGLGISGTGGGGLFLGPDPDCDVEVCALLLEVDGTNLGLLLEVAHGPADCPPNGSPTKRVEAALACVVDADPLSIS